MTFSEWFMVAVLGYMFLMGALFGCLIATIAGGVT